VSFAEWTDEASRNAWKQSPEFAARISACRALCDEFHGSDYHRATSV